ncbi:heavy metal translocating P-type ATPase [Herpetosiphon sp. NSE202]|uniref:heavy metal translocating P-type ATPase n=1 Tax=Herpetosiphon sp. NSE202 TaxID=3351349 RepID=UPI0036418CB3
MSAIQTLEVGIHGMDCTSCTQQVQKAVAALPGIQQVSVLLSSEKAIIQLDPAQIDAAAIYRTIEQAGYTVVQQTAAAAPESGLNPMIRPLFTLLGIMFAVILFVVVVGERLGLFATLTTYIPFPVGLAIVLAGGFPIFRKVGRAALRGQVISHTLMSVGVVAALVVGEWPTAAVVVFFMRAGEYAEHFTTERARRAVKDLTALAPKTARVERNGAEIELPISAVQIGDVIIVRPGEQIPVDGEVISGQATINQAAITGESMPIDTGPGTAVFAATLATLGSLRLRTTHVGTDTTFGRVIKLVEEAESHRADVQRVGDTFSAYYLPVVATIALLTFLVRGDALATAAVLVVACSCSFALATPIAMLASIGAGAKRGLLIKGGKYLEALAKADVVLLDKTGTLTLGRPYLTDVVPLAGRSETDLLSLSASAERFSEHPLAEAVRVAARERGLPLAEPQEFAALPGNGVRAVINGRTVTVGNRRLAQPAGDQVQADALEAAGKTVLWVLEDDALVGFLAVADTIRPEVPAAVARLRSMGIATIEVLTGDNERVASALAGQLGVQHRANLLPEDKIAVVRAYQARGHTVVMIGDGVNDAPALAQANIGIAMGVAGSDIALEAAHIALMREDWTLVPDVVAIARRTMRIVKSNIAFTAVYNLVGLSLAAMGLLPPIAAAAAQSLPDLGIMANSARLLRQPSATPQAAPVATPVPAPVVVAEVSCCTTGCCSSTPPATILLIEERVEA